MTSLATTAKPLPASPARAASIVALSASRLVCSAIALITLMTLSISALERPSLSMIVEVDDAASTAAEATRAASQAEDEISAIDAVSSSVALAALCTDSLTRSERSAHHVRLLRGGLAPTTT